jgi:lipoyl(octanoyl) transferase
MKIRDLGVVPYRTAWQMQEEAHASVADGDEEQLLLVEHPPVITLGRRPGVAANLLASREQLAGLGVEVVQSDRGGDITFHGPGQLVVYPIIRLIDHHLSVGGYVRKLEEIVIGLLADSGIKAQKDTCAVGVWVADGAELKKICALGVRIRRGISMHGIALNVTTDLAYFNLIVPCGLKGRGVTSIRMLSGAQGPTMEIIKQNLSLRMQNEFAAGANIPTL